MQRDKDYLVSTNVHAALWFGATILMAGSLAWSYFGGLPPAGDPLYLPALAFLLFNVVLDTIEHARMKGWILS